MQRGLVVLSETSVILCAPDCDQDYLVTNDYCSWHVISAMQDNVLLGCQLGSIAHL